MLMRGAPLAAVARILRHTDPKITDRVYGHLLPGYLKAEVDRLAFGIVPEPEGAGQPEETAADAPLARGGATVVPLHAVGKGTAGTPVANPQEIPAVVLERETGFEPATLSLGS